MLDLPDPFKPVIALKCGSNLDSFGIGGIGVATVQLVGIQMT